MKKIVYLDTNFLTIPFNFGVDIIEQTKDLIDFEVEFHIVHNTIYELENVASKAKGSEKKAAKMALSWVESLSKQKALKIDNCPSNLLVDDILVDIATTSNVIIATQDKALCDRIKELGRQVIRLRQKSKLILV